MSYLFDDTTEDLAGVFDSAHDGDLSIAMWVKKTDWAGSSEELCMLSVDPDDNGPSKGMNVSSSLDAVQCYERDSVTSGDWATEAWSADTRNGVWSLFIATYAVAGNNRTIYEEISTQLGNSTVFRTPGSGYDTFIIGNGGDGTKGHASGNPCYIAEVCLWDKVLTTTEIDQLRTNAERGLAPINVASQSVFAYYPLKNDGDLQNYGYDSGGNLTATGATWSSDHPTIDDNPVLIVDWASAESNGTADVSDSVATLGLTLAEGDVVIACISNNDTNSAAEINDNNSGAFVPITGKHQGNTYAHRCFYYKVGATPLTTFAFDMDGYSGRMTRSYVQLRNVNLDHVISGPPVTGTTSGGGAWSTMNETNGNGALAFFFGTNDNVSTTGDDWTGWDNFAELFEANGAAGQQQACAYYYQTRRGIPPSDAISKSPHLHTLFAVNPAGVGGTAVQPIGGLAEAFATTVSGTLDISITVPTGADLLVVTAGYWGAATATIEDWTTTTEPFTVVCSDEGGLGGDVAYKVWAIVNPTAKTNTITITISGDTNYHWATACCFENVKTTSVANAITVLEQNDNALAETNTLAFAQAGAPGSALLIAAAALGDDMSPDYLGATITEEFTHLFNGRTGGADPGNNDGTYYIGFRHEGAPLAPTITWALTDENAGAYLQLNPPDVSLGAVMGISKYWTRTPPAGTQIDWSNPITADLQILGDFIDGWPVNRVTQEVGSIGDGSPYVTAHEIGMVAHVDEELSPNDIFVLPKIDHAVVGRNAVTFLALVRSDSNPVAVDGYAFGYAGTGFDPFFIGESSTDDVEGRITVDGTVYADVLTDGILNGPGRADVFHVIAGKWSSSANTLYTYCNKVKSSGTATGGGSVLSGDTSTNNRPCLGANHPSAGSPYTGLIAYCAQWSRELSDDEIYSLVDNPFQLYMPQRTFIPIEFAVATGPVITDVANSGETPGSGTETWQDGSTGNVITGTGFM